ncbi:MAG TPA: transglycosylase domain-containing protein [Chloroflexota bacterium]|nr:transglycosylase domain-containing protein [Chloroflexota bacterium]
MDRRNRRRLTARRSALARPVKKPNLAIRLLVAFILSVVLMGTGGAAAALVYVNSGNLPALGAGFAGKLQFENTQIMAANHKSLFDLVNPKLGSRIVRPLELNPSNRRQCPDGKHTKHLKFYYTCNGDGIPLILREATIATEDPTFYSNPGFDPLAMARAFYQDVTSGQVQSGASTITQQMVKRYILNDSSVSITRKFKEVILAYELAQKYPKNYILYYYLNSVYYGQLANGVQAAAEAYFHVGVPHLKLWQDAMLAGMPQSPTNYDPFYSGTGTNGLWFARMLQVLQYMKERNYITQRQVKTAEQQAQAYTFYQTTQRMPYPDFIDYALGQFQGMTDPTNRATFDPYLAHRLGKRGLYDGLRIITTLNPQLQNQAQQIVTNQVAGLSSVNVTDGALVSMSVQPQCYGCIRAMVGSANVDRANEDINMATVPRQPGSSFKVFNYVSAFEKGLGPGTTVYDGPINIPDSSQPTGYYSPTDYDLTWHGVLPIREALANSLNAPAVRVEVFNGVHRVAHTAVKFGISDLWHDNPHCCGYALTLGGMERGVKLVQETAAYGAFATNGIKVPPLAFTEIVNRVNGQVLWKASHDPWLRAQRHRVAPAADTYLVTSILSDNNARQMEFGLNSYLLLDHEAAAKTGTTNDFRNNWTVGYTPQLVTGVWVGNADNSAMLGSTGITGAAPIWHAFMEQAFQTLSLPNVNFTEPPGISTGSACRIANAPPGTAYGTISTDLYAGSQPPYCSVPVVPGVDDQGTPGYQPPVTYQPPVQQVPVQPAPVTPVPTQPPVLPPSTTQAPANTGTTGSTTTNSNSNSNSSTGSSTGQPLPPANTGTGH